MGIVELLKTRQFRAEVNTLPGYDMADTGIAMTVRSAFPLAASSAKAAPRAARPTLKNT